MRNIEDIDRSVVGRYMTAYRNASAWTVSRELSAINKVLGTSYRPCDFGFIKRRTYKSIKNNRGALPKTSTAHRPENQEGLYFALATGCRRASVTTATASDAIRNETGQVMGFCFLEKGGRARNSLVLPSERETLTKWIDDKLEKGLSPNAPLVSYIDKNCGTHRMRADYARQLYDEIKTAREAGRDVYDGRRAQFINQERYERAMQDDRYKQNELHGYDKSIILEISMSLGHNRIDVALYNYLLR